MPNLSNNLELERCPHCAIDTPNLSMLTEFETRNHTGQYLRRWRAYKCSRCGGVVIASAENWDHPVIEVFPEATAVDEAIPSPAKDYLQQAQSSFHAPAGAVMLAASAVDAMLKAKDYKDGSLYNRIDKAAADHLITDEMAKWAHEVRLGANEPRHADEEAPLPTEADAGKAIDFTLALGEFLFVLPARVEKGRSEREKDAL